MVEELRLNRLVLERDALTERSRRLGAAKAASRTALVRGVRCLDRETSASGRERTASRFPNALHSTKFGGKALWSFRRRSDDGTYPTHGSEGRRVSSVMLARKPPSALHGPRSQQTHRAGAGGRSGRQRSAARRRPSRRWRRASAR